ncbi:MAG: endonuclease/exonuclease/phosphatase family protein [Pseudobdellovibrionaceae bacterium]|jgi:endonuclease/exonuclease/phosphatase family metal-dependent hydrolase
MQIFQRAIRILPFLFVLLSACTSLERIEQRPGSLSIMSYNVENLFDTEKDADRNDYEYLPLSKKNTKEQKAYCAEQRSDFSRKACFEADWNSDVVHTKMTRITNTLQQISGRGPDVLFLLEVENLSVLKTLNEKYLKDFNYQTVVLLEGDDRRGIDIGVLSRLPLAGEAQLHRIEFTPDLNDKNWKKPLTRGILEVPLALPNGDTLFAYGLHFPSQANPVQEREDAVNTLIKLMKSRGENALTVAGGDFNITEAENLKTGLFSKTLGSDFLVSHLVGCQTCEGSHYYRGEWSFLDALVFSKAFSSSSTGAWELIPESIQTPKMGKYQLFEDGSPARFSATHSVGVSDHLPVYGEIRPKQK